VNPVLSARGVGFGYGERAILRGLSVDLSPGEVTILLGQRGGKSTLIRILSGILPAREGGGAPVRPPPGGVPSPGDGPASSPSWGRTRRSTSR